MILANAITKVAEREYVRLAKGLNGDEFEIAKAIEGALLSLKNLPRGVMPCYDDEWVALLYSTWYQPSQINLAYSMIRSTMKQLSPENPILTDTGKLHVVDFGCGALAMQFAVALAAMHALNPNPPKEWELKVC